VKRARLASVGKQLEAIPAPSEGTGLPIRDCARVCNNRAQICAKLSEIDVTGKTFFERFY